MSESSEEKSDENKWDQWGMEKAVWKVNRSVDYLREINESLRQRAVLAISVLGVFAGLFVNAFSTLAPKQSVPIPCIIILISMALVFVASSILSLCFAIRALTPRQITMSGVTNELVESLRYEPKQSIADQLLSEAKMEYEAEKEFNEKTSKFVRNTWACLSAQIIIGFFIVLLLLILGY